MAEGGSRILLEMFEQCDIDEESYQLLKAHFPDMGAQGEVELKQLIVIGCMYTEDYHNQRQTRISKTAIIDSFADVTARAAELEGGYWRGTGPNRANSVGRAERSSDKYLA